MPGAPPPSAIRRCEQAIGRSTNLLVSHMGAGSGDVFARIAPRAVLAASLSFPPPETLAQVQAEIEGALREAAAGDAWLKDHPPRLEFVSGVTGAEVSIDDPLYRVVADAIRPRHRRRRRTSIRCIRRATSAIRSCRPAFRRSAWGRSAAISPRTAWHDEWVDVEDYLRAVKVAAAIIAGWCGVA